MTEQEKLDLEYHLKQIQLEWDINREEHLKNRERRAFGVRSSQISALVAYLIKENILQ